MAIEPGPSSTNDAQRSRREQPARPVPVPSTRAAERHRAVFSRQTAGLSSQHADAHVGLARRPRRRLAVDDSLRLIDDLTSRSVDPMFLDAQLAPRNRSKAEIWVSRVIVFTICIAVGFAGSLIVRQLHTDPRKEVRDTLISQLNGENDRVDALGKETRKLRTQVDAQSDKLGLYAGDPKTNGDDIANGLSAVSGEGITLTLANPLAANTDATDGNTAREGQGSHIRVITDADLQQLVSLLWHAGAEAIAINGHRIGVQTSVRTAGQTILIGVSQIQSPYKIQAIGDRNTLAAYMGSKALPSLYASYQASGIYPQIGKTNSMTLQPADTGDVNYARRKE